MKNPPNPAYRTGRPLYAKGAKKIIYIFGNPLLPFDNIPLKLVPKLAEYFPEIEFIIQDPNENLEPQNGELVIIDTVEGACPAPSMGRCGVKKISVITDIDKIKHEPSCSLHDFDLGFNLKLLAKIGKLKKIKIFGVPMKIDEEKALKRLAELIKKHG